MYNEEQKRKFLEKIESSSSRNYAEGMFNRFEKIEQKLGVDIVDFQATEIYDAIDALFIIDYGTVKQYLSVISAYKRMITGKPSDDLNASDVDLSKAIRQICIPTPEDLKREISKVRDLKQGYYITAGACFAWLGITMPTMPLIKDVAVDFNKRCIVDENCNIAIYDIDETIMDIMQQYWEVEEAIRNHHAPCKVYALHNGRFLHLMVGSNSKKDIAPIKYKNLETEFVRLGGDAKVGKEIPSKLHFKNIQRSGGLNRLYKIEKNGIAVEDMSEDEILQVYRAPGRYYDIKALYHQYKRAFNFE